MLQKKHYYSFTIFLRFWLAKIPRIIYHNQLLSTKFGRILFWYVKNDVNGAAENCQNIEVLTYKTWGWGLVVLGSEWKNCRTFHLFHKE